MKRVMFVPFKLTREIGPEVIAKLQQRYSEQADRPIPHDAWMVVTETYGKSGFVAYVDTSFWLPEDLAATNLPTASESVR